MFQDVMGKEIVAGSKVVYPARSGGKGPLQLIVAEVTSIEGALGELTVVPQQQLKITRTDRVAVVN
jgi:hypothetical protein